MISVFHLPALPGVQTDPWRQGAPGAEDPGLRVARLTPELLATQVRALRAAREAHLAERPVAEVVRAVDRVAVRLLDHGDELRRDAEARLPALTGSSPEMVRFVLDRMAADWRAERLTGLLRAEFDDPGVLDGFRPRRGGGRTRAYGPRLTMHVCSGNVPGVAVTSVIRSLLVKSAALVKTAAGEPLLAALFARGLAEADAGLGECLAVTHWPGGESALESVALEGADAVIVYGGRDAVESLRSRTPSGVRFLGYGHRLSFGVVAREALAGGGAADLARAAALDVATFDQQGCVSPHLFYVEEGGELSPREWTATLADALARVEADLPRSALAPEESSAIRQLRGEVEFAALVGGGAALHAPAGGTAWTAIFDPEPAFAASCLNRVVRVKPVSRLDEVGDLVRSLAPVLQSVGVAGPADRLEPLADALGRLGASRITPIGRMAWPPPDWHHDGLPPLRTLVRWCDWE
ncbi:MAG TPA: acyl-CoA reductase [Longimicrobiaceae bacterium]|nr:acyl-CoA reductase [Longimicrobiaceae bacterium]